MGKKIRVWDGTAWQDVAPSLPYTAIHSAQASMPATGVDGQVWLDTDGTLADTAFVPLSGGTMTGNLNTPSINSGPIVGRNKIINGDMGIWQRGTSFTSPADNAFIADRWRQNGDGTKGTRIWSRQSFTPGEISGYESQYYMRFQQSVAGSGATYQNMLIQPIEDVRTLAGKTVTLSYWAKADTAGRTIAPIFFRFYGTGSPTATDAVYGSTATLSTSWQRYTTTVNIPSISGKTISSSDHVFQLIFTPTFNIAQTIDIWGIQLEEGSVATAFTTNTANPQAELAACQRYYYRNSATQNYSVMGTGFASSSTNVMAYFQFPVTMRTTPSSIDFSTLQANDSSTGAAISNIGFQGTEYGPNSAVVNCTTSGMTTYRPTKILSSGSTSGYIGFSAEL